LEVLDCSSLFVFFGRGVSAYRIQFNYLQIS